MSRNTRPTSAGLKGLLPNPPKLIFPTPMAIMAPITTIHHGRLLGRLKARISPVTSAEPSEMVGLTLSKNFWIRYSNSKHEVMEIRVTTSAPIPK